MSQYFYRRSRHAPNPPSKRRRVTISGVALNLPSADGSPVRTPTYTHNPLVHTGSSTPISPVVMGFSIQRDDPTAIEQVRAMLSVKQKQKAVVERQRGCVSSVGVTDGLRGSTAGPLEGRRGSVLGMHPTVTPSVHIVNPTLTTATAPSPPSMTVRSGVTHRPNNS